MSAIASSVAKTGRLIVADTATSSFGVGAEILARVAEKGIALRSPDAPGIPLISRHPRLRLAAHYYPRAPHIVAAVRHQLGAPWILLTGSEVPRLYDVPDPTFTGPF